MGTEMDKIYKISIEDIPQLTSYGNYSITVPFNHIESNLAGWAEYSEVELDPDFQRAHVWDDDKRIAYVEYLLRGGVSSRTILWNCATWNKMTKERAPIQLVDGKQRLESVRKFMRGELKVFGYYFEDYHPKTFRLTNCFTFTVNDLPTRAAVLQWYLELNSGGVIHTDEELDKVRRMLAEEQNDPTQ